MKLDTTKYTWFVRERGWQGEYTSVSELSEEQAKQALCICIEAIEALRPKIEKIETLLEDALCERLHDTI